MTEKRPLILITNDDGYTANGIIALSEAMRELGEIIVFAPDWHRSGMSSAITTSQALRCQKYREEKEAVYYICNGTPVDCVKLALNEIVRRKPDLIVSGINHGSNAGISVIYSGTMGAAIEGAIFNIPSFGISLCDFGSKADFTESARIGTTVAQSILKNGLPKGVCLNVNVPKGQVKGIRITTQTQGQWVNEYMKSQDGAGREVYWITGNFENWEKENTDSDEWALANGYAAIVPVKIDMTAYNFIPEFKKWNL